MPSDPESEGSATAVAFGSDQAIQSKKALKKARKAAYIQERKHERRAREKEARKEKKRKRAERIAAGEEVSEDERASKRAKEAKGPRIPFDARVVVDLGFEDKMGEKEINSLVSQLAYTYSANRRSTTPFTSLLFTSLNGRTMQRLESMNDAGYKRWSSTEWWHEGYDRLWLDNEPDATASNDRDEKIEQPTTESSRAKIPKSSVVYLTADSPNVLEELKEGEAYIIGGICDHNRYKNLCLNKALASGIRAAQLPIGRYLNNLPTRKVLTVNQVFEILVKWAETRDWEAAFYSVIPKRKFQSAKAQKPNIAGSGDIQDEDVALEGGERYEGSIRDENEDVAARDDAGVV